MKRINLIAVLMVVATVTAFAQEVNEELIYRKASSKIEQEVRMRGYYTELPISSSMANMLWIVEQPNTTRAWSVKEYKVSMNITYMDRRKRVFKTDLNIKVGVDKDGRLTSYDIVWGRFL